MEITKISESFVKPASPTPPHQKTYKISLLDQVLAFDPDNAVILFYSYKNFPFVLEKPISETFISKRSEMLKKSLSKTLTQYYPLAGRVKDSFSVDCNDDGVRYVEARANISLNEYFSQDYVQLTNSLLPVSFDAREPPYPGSYIAVMQETTFSCGSIVIGSLYRHLVMDGIAITAFTKAWAAAAASHDFRLETQSGFLFNGPILYPQYPEFPQEASLSGFDVQLEKSGKFSLRRFLFDATSVARLQTQSASCTIERPSRSEAVSAFICKCMTDVYKARSGVDKPTVFTQLVNLRPRARPPMPQNTFGCFLWMAPALYFSGKMKLSDIVSNTRKAIRKIDADFMKRIEIGGFSKLYEMTKEIITMFTSSEFSNGVNYVMFDSLCNMGIYEIDFGWGKPIWKTVDGPPSASNTKFIDMVFLMDWNKGKGVETWIYMDEQDLCLLEKHEEFRAYASLNPNPLNPGFLISSI